MANEPIKSAAVCSGTVVEDVGFYNIEVSNADNTWFIQKRYSQFEELNDVLRLNYQDKTLPPFPPKKIKLWTSHISPQFIEERRALLHNFLTKLVAIEEIISSPEMMDFLTTNRLKNSPNIPDESKEPDISQLARDLEVTGISIPSTRTMSDHTLYQIDVVNEYKRKEYSTWTVLKRFGQFFDMEQAVRANHEHDPQLLELLPAFPERKSKMMVDHMDAEFVESRRVLLENYMKKMLQIDRIARDKDFLAFLGVM